MGTKYFKVTANERVTLEDAQIVSELEAEVAELQAQLASWYAELKPYLASGNSVEVERALIPKTLFDSLPAPAKPLSTKKMDMVWDLIKDVEDEGGRNE